MLLLLTEKSNSNSNNNSNNDNNASTMTWSLSAAVKKGSQSQHDALLLAVAGASRAATVHQAPDAWGVKQQQQQQQQQRQQGKRSSSPEKTEKSSSLSSILELLQLQLLHMPHQLLLHLVHQMVLRATTRMLMQHAHPAGMITGDVAMVLLGKKWWKSCSCRHCCCRVTHQRAHGSMCRGSHESDSTGRSSAREAARSEWLRDSKNSKSKTRNRLVSSSSSSRMVARRSCEKPPTTCLAVSAVTCAQT